MHALTDAQVIIAACSGFIVLLINAFTLAKSIANGRSIKKVHNTLDEGYSELRPDLEKAKQSLAHMERIMDARETARATGGYGRRMSDPDPISKMLPAKNHWPIPDPPMP